MKRRVLALLLVLAISVSGVSAVSASANSAAPIRPDSNSGIVFKQHDSVRVVSEVLDINFTDKKADISANYVMNNMSDNPITVETMFLSPVNYNQEQQNFVVTKDGANVAYTQEYFGETYYYTGKDSNIEHWESILAAYRTRTKPLGDGTGFKEYTLSNKNRGGSSGSYENRAEFKMTASDYIISDLKYNSMNSHSSTYAILDKDIIVTKGELEFVKLYGDFDVIPKNIPDVYEYLYDKGIKAFIQEPRFADQQFNQYLANIVTQQHVGGEPIEMFYAVNNDENYVSAVTYFVEFEPHQTLDLSVKYTTNLAVQSRGNRADFLYYLTPARYWKSFSDLTINLTLDKGRQYITDSSVTFDNVDGLHYKFSSQDLPTSELKIVVSDKMYFGNYGGYISPIKGIIIVVAVIMLACVTLIIIVFVKRKKNNKKLKHQDETKPEQQQPTCQDETKPE